MNCIPTGLDAVLDEYFGNEPLGAGLTYTLITSYDSQNRQPVFFKRFPCAVPGNRGADPAHCVFRSQRLGKAGWLAPLLSCMFDRAADAAHYQIKMFIASQPPKAGPNL